MGFESLSANKGQCEVSHRLPVTKLFVDRNESPGLEPAGVGSEVSVGELGRPTQMNEFLSLIDCQRSQNPKSARVGNKGIEGHAVLIGRGAIAP
jgi:hypothetical protein